MPVTATKGGASAFAYGFTGGAPELLGGMVLMTPTSVTATGTGSSASINANGSVTFSSCATLSLNGVFNTDYDNYMISIRSSSGTGTVELRARLRASGSDNSTASSYVSQALSATSTTVSGFRDTQSYAVFSYVYATQRQGFSCQMYGPFLAQPTAMRVVSVTDDSSARIYDNAMTHNQSTSYDGLSIFPASSTISGLIAVYGLVGT
jgi:hypothetical protein